MTACSCSIDINFLRMCMKILIKKFPKFSPVSCSSSRYKESILVHKIYPFGIESYHISSNFLFFFFWLLVHFYQQLFGLHFEYCRYRWREMGNCLDVSHWSLDQMIWFGRGERVTELQMVVVVTESITSVLNDYSLVIVWLPEVS